jgi:transposase-like protein
MERRRFTREFKLEAVRLIRDRGVSYAQASAGDLPGEALAQKSRIQKTIFYQASSSSAQQRHEESV